MLSDRPCSQAPDLWFGGHLEMGQAIHVCLKHCPWLEQCRKEPPAVSGVIAGVAYGVDGQPLRAHKQPSEVPCGNCGGNADTGACGTEKGFTRHRRRGETPCDPCRKEHNAHALRWLHAKKARAAA